MMGTVNAEGQGDDDSMSSLGQNGDENVHGSPVGSNNAVNNNAPVVGGTTNAAMNWYCNTVMSVLVYDHQYTQDLQPREVRYHTRFP